MTLQSSTLRPGLLVSLKTSIKGNVSYTKQTIEDDHLIATGAKIAKWETERKISDPEEHERACKARDKASTTLRSVCSATAFGLLCPEDRAGILEKAIIDARAIADEFNATARISRLGVYVVTGRIAPDDVEAVRAINSEVRDLMADMQEGIRNLDVKQVRTAANKAKSLGQMLSTDASEKIKTAIELARASARQIVKAGEETAQEIDLVTIKRLAECRTVFLDLDDAGEMAAVTETGRAVELSPEDKANREASERLMSNYGVNAELEIDESQLINPVKPTTPQIDF